MRWLLLIFVVCRDRRGGTDFLGGHRTVPFQHGIELVSVKILERFHFAGRPADRNAVDPGGRVQTEVYAQVVLRKIASAAVDLFGLAHSVRDNSGSRTNRQAVAAGALQLKARPVPAGYSTIPQDHRFAG